MDPDTTNPVALKLARRIKCSIAQPSGLTTWGDPVTHTICTLTADGTYQVSRQVDGNYVPVILGILKPGVARELLDDPLSKRAKRAAANVISIVDEA